MLEIAYLKTPIGTLKLSATDSGLVAVKPKTQQETPLPACKLSPLLKNAVKQLEEYFQGKRRDFDLPLEPEGTPFQKTVWSALQKIPFGETRTYQEIAKEIGNPKAARAVGGADNRNPLMIIVPCHRVIGANGSLVGYAGGLDIKRFLLELENSYL
jgi:methylated-DNA-[protein]-cysteine S-methyltransferase